MSNINFEVLEVLANAPKKKYLRKLIEYALSCSTNQKALPPEFATPISINYAVDLQLNSENAHSLIFQLIKLIKQCKRRQFINIKKIFPQNYVLAQSLTQILQNEAFQELVSKYDQLLSIQGQKFVQADWKINLQISNEGESTKNIPIVSIQLNTMKNAQLLRRNIEMNGQQFQAFFRNLVKIKEQLTQMIKQQ